MNAITDQIGTLDEAMAHASRLLEAEPALAAEQAREILSVAPNHPRAMLLLARALRRDGKLDESLQGLAALSAAQPRWAAAHFEYALALGQAGRGEAAIRALRRTVELKPDHPQAWRVLADHLSASGESEEADAAYMRHVQCSARDPALLQAATAMVDNDMPTAERLLKAHLRQKPTDVPAIRMLAEVAVRVGRSEAAESLLERCLELAPSFAPARFNYAVLLHRTNRAQQALGHIERLQIEEPRNPSYRNLLAVILARVGEYQRSIRIYDELLGEYPRNAKIWISYGHVLKTAGRTEDTIEAYRRCTELEPQFGEAYWSLANMKTFRFSDQEIESMRAQLARQELDNEHRWHFDFALGKALEDGRQFDQSFRHYAAANALYREQHAYSADQQSLRMQRLRDNFDAEFFCRRREQAESGCDAADPIFVIGMPRAGSTLVEQILSSHSQVEGTAELPDIIDLARSLHERMPDSEDAASYHLALSAMNAGELRSLGEEYMRRTRIYRKSAAPFFIDKMPNNFLHIGLIHLILPNAKIVDARRNPMACCFSNFKQHYARGQNFSYSLSDMGRYYRDYVALMAHFDTVLPGRIHRVIYEELVDDTENEVRRLLEYCGLSFEPGCLRFFENDRPVRTASAEQVRQPIYRDGVDQWRNYEEWLDPLRQALGPVLESYPAVPAFE